MNPLFKNIILALVLASILGAGLVIPGQTRVAYADQVRQDFQKNFSFRTQYGTCDFLEVFCSLIVFFRATVFAILDMLQSFFGLALNAFVFAALAMIKYGTGVMNLPVVTAGFQITLGFTNFLFVFAIIIIAFATIFRIEEYSAKRLLKNLIIAAILVNFSLLIAGLLLDTSNIFTNFFLNRFYTAGGADHIGAAIQPQQMLGMKNTKIWLDNGSINPDGTHGTWKTDPSNGRIMINEGDWDVFFDLVEKVVLVVAFTFLLLCTFIAITIMALVRTLWVAFLLILMPLTWALWVIPAVQKHHHTWWENFMKWILALPTVTFFVWLAIETAQLNTAKLTIAMQSPAGSAGNLVNQVGPLGPLFDGLINGMILCGLLIGGLIAARASGIAGAGIGMALAAGAASKIKGAGKTAFNKTIGAGARATGRAAAGTAKVAGKAALTGAAYAGTGLLAGGVAGIQKLRGKDTGVAKKVGSPAAFGKSTTRLAGNILGSRALRWIPGMKGVANTLAGAGARQGEVEEYGKTNFSNLTEAQRESFYKAPPLTDIGRAAMLQMAKDKHELHKVPQGTLDNAVAAIKRLNPGTETKDIELLKDVVKHNPLHAKEVTGQEMEDVVNKLSSSEAENMDIDALNNPQIVSLMRSNQLSAAARASGARDEAVRTTLAEILAGVGGGAGADLTRLVPQLRALGEQIKDKKDAQGKTLDAQALASKKADYDRLSAERDRTIRNMSEPTQGSLSVERHRELLDAYKKVRRLDQAFGETEEKKKGQPEEKKVIDMSAPPEPNPNAKIIWP